MYADNKIVVNAIPAVVEMRNCDIILHQFIVLVVLGDDDLLFATSL